jgi:molecular chaperone DnaK
MLEAEDAKRALSAREEVTIHFAYGNNRVRLALDRKRFESITGDLLERTIFTIKKVLKEAGLTWKDIPRILLVGGSTRMPMVAARLGREFETKVDRSLAPDEAVAHGAALYAEFLTARGGAAPARMSIRNVNSHDLGVLAIEDATNQPRRHVQIPRNTALPATGRSRFHTRRDDQRHVGVPVIEGGDASGRDATHIGQCVVSDLPPGLPSGTPIDVAFTYAEDGRLTVEAELPSVNRRAMLVIERASGLSAEVLHQWEERIAGGSLPGMEPAADEPVYLFPSTEDESPQPEPEPEPQREPDRQPAPEPEPQPAPQSEPPPDTFRITCPNGHTLTCPLWLQGKAGKCPKCGARFFVPLAEPPEPEAPEEEPADAGPWEDPQLDDFLKGLGEG